VDSCQTAFDKQGGLADHGDMNKNTRIGRGRRTGRVVLFVLIFPILAGFFLNDEPWFKRTSRMTIKRTNASCLMGGIVVLSLIGILFRVLGKDGSSAPSQFVFLVLFLSVIIPLFFYLTDDRINAIMSKARELHNVEIWLVILLGVGFYALLIANTLSLRPSG
jgi:uncharacterized membrane protein AbrB (regulator of aidB expression)